MTETVPAAIPTPQTPPDIGSVLRQARLKRGQSLEAVFQHTRIPKKFIEALETNRFEVFPASVYLQGFLKTYCDHLEVDFEPLWNQIAPPKSKTESKQESPAPATASAAPKTITAPAAASRHAETGFETPAMANAKIMLPIAIAIAALAAFWALQNSSRSLPSATPPPPPAKLPAALAPLRPPEAMKLRIIFRREAWMRLYADGHLRFEGRAPAGYSQEWKAMDAFTLRTPKSDDVELALDGKPCHLDTARKDSSGDYKIVRPQ